VNIRIPQGRTCPNQDFRACCTTSERGKINRIGQRPIVRDNYSVKPCKGVIIWMSGFQPVERDVDIFHRAMLCAIEYKAFSLKMQLYNKHFSQDFQD